MEQKQILLFIFILTAISIFSACSSSRTLLEGDSGNTGGRTITRNQTGIYDGFGYELWKDNPVTARMILGNSGTFTCSWNSNGNNNVLFRTGRKFASRQRHEQIGNITVNYKASWSPSNTGVSYLCIYGWTQGPLIEYYIVDDWGHSNRPPGSWSDAAHKGTIEIDGGVYDIYVSRRTNKPSIEGTRSFDQYWSVRRTKRTEGTISVSEHFKKWESLGMNMGRMFEVALTVEGFNSSGTAEITQHILTIR